MSPESNPPVLILEEEFHLLELPFIPLPLFRQAMGSCNFFMAFTFMSCICKISAYTALFILETLSKCFWQTFRSSLSWSFTSAISLFFDKMKFISSQDSFKWASNFETSFFLQSKCSLKALHFSLSEIRHLVFSLISASIFFFSNSFEAIVYL
jgi:hypothetical protein